MRVRYKIGIVGKLLLCLCLKKILLLNLAPVLGNLETAVISMLVLFPKGIIHGRIIYLIGDFHKLSKI